MRHHWSSRKCKTHIKFVFFFLVFTGSIAAQTNEAWVKYERNGEAFGYEHIEVYQLEGGKTRYDIHQVIKTEAGGFAQEISQIGYYIVDEYLKPVSLQFDIEAFPNKISLAGECKNGILHLNKNYEGGESQQFEIPIEYVYFDAVMGKVILWKRYEKEFVLKVYNPFENKVNEYFVEIKRTTEGGIFATLRERITINMLIDREGKVKRIVYQELNADAVLTDPDDATDIDYLKTDNELTLTLDDESKVPNFYDISHALIKVSWKGIAFEDFRFEDCRQKEIKREEEEDNYSVTLDFQRPIDVRLKASQLEDQQCCLFLEETEFIKPNDPSIQGKLAEIRNQTEEGNYALVKKILLWIYGNIKAIPMVENLSGPEVLKKGIGKCTEYAALFSSLTRAAEIPTKIVFGVSQIKDMWTGHIWCEVWLGEWLAVDPSNGIFIFNPSHIKFADSPNLIGHQALWWRLVDNLRVEVIEYK